jgi:glutamyl-tRNA(Gln) amidotransferase subunit E
MPQYDYKNLGLKCGLEIHQQLDTKTKLFCRCPSELQGTKPPDFTILRYMRPVLGEMGEYDEAMLTEYEKGMTIIYEGYKDSICTYELDETPPFECNPEGIDIAILIGSLLKMTIFNEIHISRKNYLDGSVPCGFQRTSVIATDGELILESGKKMRIDFISLEEDAARRIKTENKTNYFRLDRLGIPLVEITTKPDIRTPQEARDCAERIGLLLWGTGKVRTILGSIRQDLNISIATGNRIEIKGVQKLDWFIPLINNEISRQLKLVEITEILKKNNRKPEDIKKNIIDLSEELKNTKCSFVNKGIKSGKKLLGINLSGFNGLYGIELQPNRRFGTEVSSKVTQISGLKGLIHSDEDLSKYGFSETEMSIIKNKLNSKDEDCFVLVLGKQKNAMKAMDVIIKRTKLAFNGVPGETRRALEDGNTEFLRELHGGARLYPDTDSKAIPITNDRIKNIQKNLPEFPWDLMKSYSKQYEISENSIKELIFEGKLKLFEKLIEVYNDNPTLIITTLLETTKALSRDGINIINLTDNHYLELFTALKNNEIGKEIIEDILMAFSKSPSLSLREVKKQLKITRLSEDELITIIQKLVNKEANLIKENEMRAFSPLMGELMKKAKGKIDGKIIAEKLKKAIKNKLEELKK